MVRSSIVVSIFASVIASNAVAQGNPFDKYSPPWTDDDPPLHSWRSETGFHYIYERDIIRDGKTVTAWIRDKYWTLNNGAERIMSRMTFDCKGRYQYSAQTSYRPDGTVLQQIDRMDDWVYIRPDSANATYETVLCGS